jgi:hypothetical protein
MPETTGSAGSIAGLVSGAPPESGSPLVALSVVPAVSVCSVRAYRLEVYHLWSGLRLPGRHDGSRLAGWMIKPAGD